MGLYGKGVQVCMDILKLLTAMVALERARFGWWNSSESIPPHHPSSWHAEMYPSMFYREYRNAQHTFYSTTTVSE